MAGLWIRDDMTPQDLRRLARSEKDTRVARRLLAIAGALEGLSREAAARLAGMDRQTLRDWVIRTIGRALRRCSIIGDLVVPAA